MRGNGGNSMKRLRKFISLLLVLSMLLGLTVTASADGGGNTAEDPGQADTPAPVSAGDQDNNEEIDEDVEESAEPKEACLTINDIDYHCRYDETDKKYTFGVYNWVEGTNDEEAHWKWETKQLPTGVSYDYTSNTLTLSSATLTSLCLSYSGVDEESGEIWYNLPNANLTINLVGENTLTDGLGLYNGACVTFTGDGSLTLGSFFDIGEEQSLTVTGGTLTMPGGWLNGTYTQTGGTVHVTGVADGDGTYYQGLSFGSAANISGGTLNVNVNVSPAENEDINAYWAGGINFNAAATISGDAEINVTVNRGVAMVVNNGSTYTQTGGTVTVVNTDNNDPSGFTVDGAGINEWEDEEEKHSESYSASTANISGGKLIVKGKLNVNGTLNLSGTGEITVTAIDGGYNFPPIYDEYGNDTNWQGAILVMANTTGTANLNINGGTLTAEALHGNAPTLCVGTSGVYTQNGGKVDLINTHYEGRAMDIENIATVNGGVLNATGDANGIWVNAGYSNVSQMRFVVNGGEVNATGGIRGLVAYGYYTEIATGRLNGATVVLNGGKLTARGGNYGAMIISGYWILDEEDLDRSGLSADMVDHIISAAVSVLRVTGGEHSFIGETTGLSLSGDTEITGGTLHLSGGTTAIYAGQVKTNGVAWSSFTMGSNMHAVSDNTGAELTLVANEATDYHYSDDIDSYYREGNTVYGSYATDVTISPASGVVPTTYAATLDVQTGVITAGAPVTVVYNVSGNGYVSFTLPEGVELVEGSLSDGETLRGLTDIPVNGAATISFQVVPREKGNFTVTATFTQTSGQVKEEIEFTAGGFDISLPTYTSKYLIRANGVGVPGETVTVRLKNKADSRTVSASTTVTELGTFALNLDLSQVMDVTTTERAEFEITVTENGRNYAYDQTVVYEQSIPQVDWVTVTNTVHGVTQSVAVDEVTTIDFSNGYGKPDRSFYTYWPELRTFRFAVKLVSNDGVKGVCVRVYYQDDTTVDVKLELGTDGVWRETAGLDRAPVGYQVIIVYELRTDPVDPDTPDDPVTPAPGGDEDDPTVNPNVIIIRTEIVPIIPIMDPSGTVYSQFTGMPVAGATATLYYGGNGTAPGEPTLFDMTNYGQVNPMTTDALGHYAWNVPEGWWKVVVSYGSSSTESEWMHVLPVQTGVDLYLTDGTYVIPTVPSTKPTDKKDDKKDDETAAPVFSDVSSSQWFYDDVVYMAENGLMTGVGVGSFAPNSSLTRGMVVTMLARMAGVDTSTGSVWYEAGRTWAMQNGVSDGTGMTDDITREQLAAMLYRYAKLMGEDTSAAADLSAFSDADQISGWAVEAMAWAVQRGILQGADGKLMPGGTATRAQAAAMFHRFLTK